MKPPFAWMLLALLFVFVLALAALSVEAALDGDSGTATQGGSAVLVLLGLSWTVFQTMRRRR
ncbi:hypothetical protein FNU79_11265 [Deinococcus detaillensis]|uniref:Uncharacterized protein n=1 Tax=Deinococcus detaillensis TaxID=2592048 RepID=A0A553UWE4_9DEIO|nr:hypothetical protein [Deinococcus detaillensis]TSA84530.1 hypothetical protein FNU79_11265 [Deinococcus detaillensis]